MVLMDFSHFCYIPQHNFAVLIGITITHEHNNFYEKITRPLIGRERYAGADF